MWRILVSSIEAQLVTSVVAHFTACVDAQWETCFEAHLIDGIEAQFVRVLAHLIRFRTLGNFSFTYYLNLLSLCSVLV